jgi:hypothetical protein
MGVVELFELAEGVDQVPVVPDQGSVEQLAPTGLHPPFHDRVHAGYLDTGEHDAGNECVGKGLDPGDTCEMQVLFQPTMAGQRTATLVIHQNLPPPDRGTQVRLAGHGGAIQTRAFRATCGAKPFPTTTYASHLRHAIKPPKTIASPTARLVG